MFAWLSPSIAIECEKIDIFRESVKMLISFILNIKRKLVCELPTIRNYIHKQCNMVVVFCCNRELLVNFKKVISFRFHLRDNLVYKCSQESLSVWLFWCNIIRVLHEINHLFAAEMEWRKMTARSGLKIVHNGVVFHRYECKHDTTDYFLRCAAKIVTAAEKILANYRTVSTELKKTF